MITTMVGELDSGPVRIALELYQDPRDSVLAEEVAGTEADNELGPARSRVGRMIVYSSELTVSRPIHTYDHFIERFVLDVSQLLQTKRGHAYLGDCDHFPLLSVNWSEEHECYMAGAMWDMTINEQRELTGDDAHAALGDLGSVTAAARAGIYFLYQGIEVSAEALGRLRDDLKATEDWQR